MEIVGAASEASTFLRVFRRQRKFAVDGFDRPVAADGMFSFDQILDSFDSKGVFSNS